MSYEGLINLFLNHDKDVIELMYPLFTIFMFLANITLIVILNLISKNVLITGTVRDSHHMVLTVKILKKKYRIFTNTGLIHLNVHSLQQRIWIANHIIQLKHTVRLNIKNVLQMHMFVKIFFKKKNCIKINFFLKVSLAT